MDDDEFSRLLAAKGSLTWKEFLIDSHLSNKSNSPDGAKQGKSSAKAHVIVNGGEVADEVRKLLKMRFGEKVRVEVQHS